MRILKPAGSSLARTAAAVTLLALLSGCAYDALGYAAISGVAEQTESLDNAEAPPWEFTPDATSEPEAPAPSPAPSRVTVDGQSFVYVRVTSDTASAYHWILDTRWQALGSTNAARRAAVLGSLVFGPEGVGDRVPLRREARYRFIPICGGQPRWDLVQSRGFSEPGTLELRCQ